MRRDHNVVEHIVEKEIVTNKIQLLLDNLTTIKDSGEFLLQFGDVVVDDKSWNVWNWPQGVGLYGIYKYYQFTGDTKALKICQDWFENQLTIGAPPKNINTMAPLLTMAFLYEEFGDSRFLPYLESWSQWAMETLPRTDEGGFEHLTYGEENVQQMWDDTLMMTVLPLAKIGQLLNRSDYLEEAKRQFMLHTKYLADRKTGLWFHGWNFSEKHHYAGALWGRGNCWITIAIPEIIDILHLEKNDALYLFLVETLEAQVATLAKIQHESGLWSTLLLEPESYEETSCTAGFAYGILKSVRLGYVDEKYRIVGEKAILALLEKTDENGDVHDVSVGTGLEDNLDYYRNIAITSMPYGPSLNVLALTEFLHDYI
ncbi:beta-galactosidase BglB [Enterococcus timonensis]|uniref:beta-galactosidase BglB n=1 Tax=Enterococcus timonensis TaxID=1852364 RepID=UPI0008DABCCE|nr:glycoside hydrolase family 88 protein [Enterococcus timonensis]